MKDKKELKKTKKIKEIINEREDNGGDDEDQGERWSEV
jgi:hypothetical protein